MNLREAIERLVVRDRNSLTINRTEWSGEWVIGRRMPPPVEWERLGSGSSLEQAFSAVFDGQTAEKLEQQPQLSPLRAELNRLQERIEELVKDEQKLMEERDHFQTLWSNLTTAMREALGDKL